MRLLIATLFFLVAGLGTANAAGKGCPAGYVNSHKIDVHAHSPFRPTSNEEPKHCTARMSNEFSLPDPMCSPGAYNPTLMLKILRDRNFTTKCVRDKATTPKEKAATYEGYGIEHPAQNSGKNMVCELDHIVPLEMGGADTLDNIWPQCGPSGVALAARYFKAKDTVENFLTAMVKANKAALGSARTCIAKDWTKFVEEARRVCHGTTCDVSLEGTLDVSGC